ncbi:unnamed protein product, partial [Staurois parvus]
GSLYGLPLLLSPSPTLCHVPLSGLLTLLVCSIFVIGCCMASHWCCASTATLWLHTLVFGPVTAQMSEVCGESKIDGALIACHNRLTVLFPLPPTGPPRGI